MSKAGTARRRNSVQLKFALTFFLLLAILITFLNTYPVIMSRDIAFRSKESSMTNHASVMSSSLSAQEKLTPEGVQQAMDVLNVTGYNRVIITGDDGLILYDTSESDSSVGKYALFSEICLALSGKIVFYSNLTSDAFQSRAATPVVSHGTTIGAVYLYEYDEQQLEFMTEISSILRNISIVASIVTITLILLFSRALTARITELLGAIRIVHDGEYGYSLKTRGNDELTELGEQFNTLSQRLKSTEELRRRFVSDASHELKTPLASIRLLTDSIIHSDNMDMETVHEFVSDIGNEAARLQRMTEKLLNLTRLDDRAQTLPQPVNAGDVAESTLHLLSPLARERNVSLEFTISDNCVILASEDDLYHVIFNLVENAIKYNVDGGSVRFLLYRSQDEINLIVDDTGIGIPQEDLPHVFSRFYRVDKARTSDAGGSGLGLSIVHDTVSLYGGSVEIQPRKPRGTRFHVRFPVPDPDAPREADE